jgi:hypothetical protein
VSDKPRVVLRPRAGTTAEQARETRLRALTYLFAQRIEREQKAAGEVGGGHPRKEIHEHNSGTPSIS